MKRLIFLTLVFVVINVYSQEKATVKKSLTGIQVAFLGAELYNEARLSDDFSLRSQLELHASIWLGPAYSKTGFALVPSISLTPKFYYNLRKRVSRGKNATNNSGNYLAAKLMYVPEWFVITNSNEIEILVNEAIIIIPTWGFRRNFARHFNYEFRAGVGLGKELKKSYSPFLAIDLSFKVGYDF